MNPSEAKRAGESPSSGGSAAPSEEQYSTELWQSLLELRSEITEPGATPSPTPPGSTRPSTEDEPVEEERSSFLEEEPAAWRRELLCTLTYAALAVGLPTVTAAIYAAYAGERPILVPLWLCLYLPLLALVFLKQMSYEIRAGVLVGVVYGMGLLSYFQPGYRGDGTPILLFGAFLAPLLLGESVAAPSLVMAFATGALASWSSSTGLLFPAAIEPGVSNAVGWLWSPFVIVVLGAGLVLAATRCRQRLATTVARGRRLEQDLEDRRAQALSQEEDLDRRASQLKAADELMKLAAFQLDLEQVLRRILEVVSDQVPCHSASIFLPDDTGKQVELHSSTGTASAELAAQGLRYDVGDESLVGWAARHQEPYVALDVQEDPIYSPHLLLRGTQSEAAFPLVVDNQLAGVLDVHATEQDAFSEADVAFLGILVDWAALALENRRLASARTASCGPAYRASSRLSAAATKAEVVDAIVDSVAETRAGTCLVAEFIRDSKGDLDSLLCLRAWRRGAGARLEPGTRLPVSSTLFPIDLLQGTWKLPDIASDERLSDDARDLFNNMGVRALVGFPLTGAEESFGQVLVLYGESGPFSSRAMRLYELLQNQAGLAVERAQKLDDVRRQARRAKLASEATVALYESFELEEVLSTAARDIAKTMGLAAVDVRLGPPNGSRNGEGAEGLADARARPVDRRGEKE